MRGRSPWLRDPSRMRLEDLDSALLGAFLDHLEHERANTPRTRNMRLAAPPELAGIGPDVSSVQLVSSENLPDWLYEGR